MTNDKWQVTNDKWQIINLSFASSVINRFSKHPPYPPQGESRISEYVKVSDRGSISYKREIF